MSARIADGDARTIRWARDSTAAHPPRIGVRRRPAGDDRRCRGRVAGDGDGNAYGKQRQCRAVGSRTAAETDALPAAPFTHRAAGPATHAVLSRRDGAAGIGGTAPTPGAAALERRGPAAARGRVRYCYGSPSSSRGHPRGAAVPAYALARTRWGRADISCAAAATEAFPPSPRKVARGAYQAASRAALAVLRIRDGAAGVGGAAPTAAAAALERRGPGATRVGVRQGYSRAGGSAAH